jgi:hypothetical protein
MRVGPDGALWFAEQYGNKIGRVTTAGAFTEYPLRRLPNRALLPRGALRKVSVDEGSDLSLYSALLSSMMRYKCIALRESFMATHDVLLSSFGRAMFLSRSLRAAHLFFLHQFLCST